jgi:hypothetical protein
MGDHRAVRLLQPDHLGALDAARAGRGPRLPRRRRGLGRDHGPPGGWRHHGRPALPGQTAPAAHGARHRRDVLLRAARHPDGPARGGPLGGGGRLCVRCGLSDLQRLHQHRPPAADTAGAAGPGQLAHAVPGLRHRRHRVRGRRAARRRRRTRAGLRGRRRLRPAEQRGHAGRSVGPGRALGRPGAGTGRSAPARDRVTEAPARDRVTEAPARDRVTEAPAGDRVTAACGTRPAGPRRRPAVRPR